MVLLAKFCPVSGSRIGAGEDAAALVVGHHASGAQHALLDARRLEVAEEERAVAHHRAAEVAAELILVVRRLRLIGPLGEEVVRVERVVAEEVVRRAADAVGSGLRC